jgi:hypothetical protein
MAKHLHEIRDPIHGFIRVETPERKILDSRALQRLRHVYQLSMTHLIYPGATHRRFEHSLGVMELAGKVFDVLTHPANVACEEFLKVWLPGGTLPVDPAGHLRMTDNEVTAAILLAAESEQSIGHRHAACIVGREHFRLLYQRNPEDVTVNSRSAEAVAGAAADLYGEQSVHYFSYTEKNRALDFPVRQHDGRVVSCLSVSDVLRNVPVVSVEYVFIAPKHRDAAKKWLDEKRAEVIAPKEGAEA